MHYPWPKPDPGQRMPVQSRGPLLAEPNSCAHCHLPERGHARQWTEAAGSHAWTSPTDAQRLRRMLSRRAARQGDRPGVVTHSVQWVCPKADREARTSREQVHASWWLFRTLVMAISAVAEQCPHLGTDHVAARLVVNDTAVTIDHRPVALRTLVVACDRCPAAAPSA
ncbi:hypothetical protein [Kitasatospora sp. MBT63]|uniref:hypothetical protein n=1 Tax=Kitasatospora sp. MBT63 TaxID=1444768 RepID=UPI00053A9367|nr:hypothetical protein [Kitasatospora sp. MBT63]